MRAPVELFLASSNPGKLAEYRVLARTVASPAPSTWGSPPSSPQLTLKILPAFDALPAFEENAPTFAENAAGKALHYSHFHDGLVFAEDSGLVISALGGAPGVHSARYAGPTATSAQRNAKLLAALKGKTGAERAAHFVCVIALAQRGRAIEVVSDRVDGEILESPAGSGGFGYDPIFYFPPLQKAFAELSAEEKNAHSHRGSAFRKLIAVLQNA